MLAVIYILLCWCLGMRLLKLATGSTASWWLRLNRRSFSGNCADGTFLAPAAQAAGGLWLGFILLSWLVYLFALIFDAVLKNSSIHPLLPANLTIMLLSFIWLLKSYYSSINKILRNHRKQFSNSNWSNIFSKNNYDLNYRNYFLKQLFYLKNDRKFRNILILFFMTCFFLILFSTWLMTSSFKIENNYLAAGYSVFSDFAPHTALVSSFSQGQNWPTQYPHFAGDGISYHFMFFFLCGNLNYLGLSLASAINLPSILGIVSAMILLGTVAVVLTGKSAVFYLTPLLTLARSSMAFFTYLGDLYKRHGIDLALWINEIKFERTFIGNTPHDDWGLWAVNVYANQRHLMPAIAVMLLVFLLFLPTFSNKNINKLWLNKEAWLNTNSNLKEVLIACLLLFMLPYWHGSVLITTLIILAVFAIKSEGKAFYLLAASGSFIGALLQAKLFSGGAQKIVSFSLQWGFISEDTSIAGVLAYLFELMGLSFLLIFLFVIISGKRIRFFTLAAIAPLIFAFTVSLTPDITVNHKYIMLATIMLNIWIGDLLIKLWANGKKAKKILMRAFVLVIILPLIITGIMEWHIFRNINKLSYKIELNTPMTDWIRDNTEPDAVFLTAPYHYHKFFLTGRLSWLGHSYYAWSAGHDTGMRFETEQWLFGGADLNPDSIYKFTKENNIAYLLIDDTLRQHDQFYINENFYEDNFTKVAAFPHENNAAIYSLKPNNH